MSIFDLRGKPKVQRAINSLLNSNKFFSTLLLKSEIVYTEDIPTMATDGLRLLINTEFTNKIEHEEIIGVIVHELLHMIYSHSHRRGNRNPKRFNAAADYAINPIVKDSGFKLPHPHLDNPDFHGMTAEKIYDKLPDEPDDPNSIGEDIQDPQGSKAEQQQQQEDMKIAVAQASHIAGEHVPDAIKQEVKDMLTDKVDWKTKLRDFMTDSLEGDDVSWARPNKRFLGQEDPLYLPIHKGYEAPAVSILLDTSGSIAWNKDLFDEFCGETNNLIEDLSPERVDVFCVDTTVRDHKEYSQGEIPTYELHGGGGTDFREAWPKLEATGAQCIIAFTDAYAHFPKHSSIPTLWICYDRDDIPEVPFGEVTIIK